jgi:type I restriction enzyme S subunit
LTEQTDLEAYSTFQNGVEFEREIGDLVSTRGGGTPSTDVDEYWGGDILWLTPSEISDEKRIHVADTERKLTEEGLSNTSAKVMPPGSVLMTSRATVGVPVINEKPMATNQGFICIDIAEDKPLYNYYLLYWIKRNKGVILNHASGSTYPEISQRSFNGLKISLPSLPEQKKIADTLRHLDEKREVNDEMNRELAEMAQSIFKYLFIDFSNTPDDELVLHEGLNMDVPTNWGIEPLSDVARIVDCLHSKKPDEQNEGQFYIEVKDVGELGELNLDDKYRISNEDYEEWTRRITAKSADLIITKDGRVGAVAQIPNGVEGAIGRNLVCIRPESNQLSSTFLREYMLSPLMKQEIGKKTLSRAIFETLHVSEIENLRILLPPKNIRKEFDEVVGAIHERIDHNNRESIKLETARKELLAKLIPPQ